MLDLETVLAKALAPRLRLLALSLAGLRKQKSSEQIVFACLILAGVRCEPKTSFFFRRVIKVRCMRFNGCSLRGI